MSSGLTGKYLEFTATRSFCSSGRNSGPDAQARSCAMMSCRRSLATEAVAFFSPNMRESQDMSLASEQTLDQAWLLVLDEAQRVFFAEEAGDRILVGVGHRRAFLVDRGDALVGGLQYGLGFGNDAQQRNPQQFLDVGVGQHLAFVRARRRGARGRQGRRHRIAAFDGAPTQQQKKTKKTIGVAY